MQQKGSRSFLSINAGLQCNKFQQKNCEKKVLHNLGISIGCIANGHDDLDVLGNAECINDF
jgi:hypothetical protein